MNLRPAVTKCLFTLGAAVAAPALEAEPAPPERLPRAVVSGFNDPALTGFPLDLQYAIPNPADLARAQDAAGLLEGIPGVAVVRNGPQTGMPQLRGLHADRVKVLVDGMTLTPACPNHMDPPLHYLAPAHAGSLLVVPGVTPVSLGGDSIAGTIVAESSPPSFSTNRVMKPFGEVSGAGHSVNDGWAAAATAGLANRDYSVSYDGSAQGADDYRFPGGRVRATGYDITHQRLRGAADTLHGLFSAEAGLSRTRDAGTPALPMDMIEDDGYHGAVAFDGDLTVATLESRLFYHHTDHLMDNYSLRPAGARRLFSPATSSDFGFTSGLAMPRGSQTYRLGAEFHGNWFDAYQQNAANGMRQTTINDGTRQRFGAYGEWQNDWSERWRSLVGVRADSVWSDVGAVEDFFPEAKADAAAFNRDRRAYDDLSVDAMAALRFTANDWSTYEIGAARKNRAPSLVERYLWTPLSASAGQADGRTYLGNLGVDPETAWQFNVAGDWHGPRWRFKVSPFFTLVDGYIQGRPIGRLDMNKLPVLEYTNLDQAELYGVDAGGEWEFVKQLTLGGSLSYVRGKDCENDDNLYRIAPLRGRIGLDWTNGRFEAGVEGVLAAEQDEVSAYNGEPTTPGYAILNLRAGWEINRHMNLQVGLENVFDVLYSDHLGGINRVSGSDVGVGERLPGYGRAGYVALRFRWD